MGFKSDIEIAQEAELMHINEIAKIAGVSEDYLELYGKYKAKVDYNILNDMKDRENGKLILVTAINPTPAGEGKTTVSVGLGDALKKIGKNTVIALREPSLGPVFGVKGGAAGGGYAQLIPMEDINLHFTGDIHAVTTANNCRSATYASLPRASSICLELYSLSAGMSLVNGVCISSKNSSYMTATCLSIITERKGICHQPVILFVFLFQGIQKS